MKKAILIVSSDTDKGKRILRRLKKAYPGHRFQVVILEDQRRFFSKESILTTLPRGIKYVPFTGARALLSSLMDIFQAKADLLFIIFPSQGYRGLLTLGIIAPVGKKRLVGGGGEPFRFSSLKIFAFMFGFSEKSLTYAKFFILLSAYFLVYLPMQLILKISAVLLYPFKLGFLWLKLKFSGVLDEAASLSS